MDKQALVNVAVLGTLVGASVGAYAVVTNIDSITSAFDNNPYSATISATQQAGEITFSVQEPTNPVSCTTGYKPTCTNNAR